MSFTSQTTDFVTLINDERPSPLTESEYYIADYFSDEDHTLERQFTRTRGSTFRRSSTAHTEIQELQTLAHVLPIAFIYDENAFDEKCYSSIDNIPTPNDTQCLWIDVIGVHDKVLLSQISRRFKVHPLVISDIETHEQRTKLDIFEDALFLVVKLIYPDRNSGKTHVEQMSFYLKKNILITFQERSNTIFVRIKNRIRQSKGRIRKSKIDYLFYSLIDAIVDEYMDVLDLANSKIEAIDHQLMENISRKALETVYDLKRDMLDYRRVISPLKEIINRLQKEEETQIVQESTIIYLKDLFDHVVQVTDTIDTQREMLASFIDFYMMLNSNAMNEVVKTLTIISTIFIPLTFIAGVYGMNFDYMPETNWRYGYFAVLGVMLAIALIMLWYFKRKKWL